MRNAAERLVLDDGLVVVFAAGNNGGDGTTVQTAFNSNSPSVISVANYYDRTGDLDGSSSRGLTTDAEHVARSRRTRHADHLDRHDSAAR